MQIEGYVASLRADSEALAAAASQTLEPRVPSCPDWTIRDLVVHTGKMHRFWCEIVERGLRDHRDVRSKRDPGDRDPIEWFNEGAAHLADVLLGADPSVPVWSWSLQKDVAFVQRRMPQETAVHRWDAQSAVGSPQPIDATLAADGIDELFDVFFPAQDPAPAGSGETVHLHRTDGDGEWLIRLTAGGLEVERGHVKGDAAVRGTASDLLLMLWRRILPSDLDVLGDGRAVQELLAWPDLT